jgi:hypothetical protein
MKATVIVLLLAIALVAIAMPAAAQSNASETDSKWLHAAIAASIVAHGADLSTTSWALGKAGDRYHEANPVMKPFAGDPTTLAVAKMGSALAVNYALLKLHKRRPKTILAIAVTQSIAIAYVAHRNAALLGLR